MPKFHFTTRDETAPAHETGVELRDLPAARKHAIVFAGAVLQGEPEVLWDGRELYVDVKNEDGLLLFTLTAFVANAPAGGDTR